MFVEEAQSAADHGAREYAPGDEQRYQTGGAEQEQAQAGAEQAGEQAERIAAEGEDVREQVRQLIADTVHDRRLSLEQLNTVAQSVLEGAASGVREATSERQDSVLRSVVDGIGDGYAAAADATRQAVEDATQRGKHFAEQDLKRAWEDLRELDSRFFRVISATAQRGWGALTGQASAVQDQARRAGESIRPSAEQALRALKEHPVQFGSEAAAAGVEATRQTAGRLLNVMAGILQGAGDALSDRGEKKDQPKQ
jgi:hypothetical protein